MVSNGRKSTDVDEKAEETQSVSDRPLKTTGDGIVLVPQPSDDPDDPLVRLILNWPSAKKHTAMIVLALMSFVLKFTTTLIAPGAHKLAAQFHTPSSKATYIGTAPTITFSVAPFLWIPLSHRYGRRPVLLVGNLIAIAFSIGVARSESYAQALICRMFMGFGGCVGLCIGPAAVADIFFLHERGKHMGLNTLLLICAPYAGGVAGGSIQYKNALGWRWSMYVAAIMYGALFVAQLLLVPETIYERKQDGSSVTTSTSRKFRKLGFRKLPKPEGHGWYHLFSQPCTIFCYPAVLLPSFWFSVCGMTEVVNTAGFPLNFGEGTRWDFNTQQVGFCSFSGFIGAILGELFAGPICDFVIQRSMKRGGDFIPEKLFHVLWTSMITIPAGLLLYGLELNYPTGWAAALTGVALFAFGQEIMVTTIMTYMVSCYPKQAAEVAVVFQFWRNLIAFPGPFFVPQWIKEPGGAKVPYIVFAILPLVLWPLGAGIFLWRGPQIRAKGLHFWKDPWKLGG